MVFVHSYLLLPTVHYHLLRDKDTFLPLLEGYIPTFGDSKVHSCLWNDKGKSPLLDNQRCVPTFERSKLHFHIFRKRCISTFGWPGVHSHTMTGFVHNSLNCYECEMPSGHTSCYIFTLLVYFLYKSFKTFISFIP